MQGWVKAVEPLNTILDKWSGEDKSTWNDQLAAFKANLTASMFSEPESAAIQEMQNWLKAARPLITSLNQWPDETKSTWNEQINTYKAKITSSIPSDGGLAATADMQSWVKTAEPLNASLDKWDDEDKSTWQDQFAAYKAEITASISSGGGITATEEMLSWMKAVEPFATSLMASVLLTPPTNSRWILLK